MLVGRFRGLLLPLWWSGPEGPVRVVPLMAFHADELQPVQRLRPENLGPVAEMVNVLPGSFAAPFTDPPSSGNDLPALGPPQQGVVVALQSSMSTRRGRLNSSGPVTGAGVCARSCSARVMQSVQG